MKIIITGSTGMIGLALIRLLHEKHEIYAIVRPSSSNIPLLEEYSNINIIECDLNNLNQVLDYTTEADIFFHLGWKGTTGNKTRNANELQLKNITYTLDAMKLSEKLNCKSFVGAGSQAEYGIQNEKLNENTPVNPVTSYGIAKYAAGKLGKNLSEELNVKFCWTRILSVYGPGLNHTMINSCIESILKNVPFDTTEGEQEWDYIYSLDCAKALYEIAINGIDGETYVIGSGKTRKIREYINVLKENINPDYEINFGKLDYSPNQIMYLCADISKLKKDTNFKVETTFEKGIKEMIDWYLNNTKLGEKYVQSHMCIQ